MNQTDKPGRRRALVTATATVTAIATIAGLGFLGLTTSPSVASAASTEPGASTRTAVGLTATAPEPVATASSPAASTAATSTAPSPVATAAADPATEPVASGSLAGVKNVVFVLADDLDWNLFEQVPRLAALQEKGMTFTHHTVTDSLCCPSRTSILRGQYIHNHGVVSNLSRTGGGWPTFRDKGEHTDCLPVWLQSAGVTTALFGKYLNEYPATPRSSRYVPPGWDTWGVPTSRGDSYTGYDYTLNDNGRLVRYGSKASDFLNDVITSKATDFIRTAPDGFFVTLSTYNPHKPSPVALRNKATHAATVAPRTPNYNKVGINEPSWLRDVEAIPAWKQTRLDRLWRQRAQSAESVADSVDSVLATLAATGRADDTLVVVTSDNGYHVGTHRLTKGKRTAFREDTVVPLVVIGPGVTPGARIDDAMTSTIDLAPTFTSILGAQAPTWVDGRSLTELIATGEVPATWRHATISESLGTSGPGDPDYQPQAPPQYTSLRTPEWLFVVYRDGERELYDLAADPYELNNIIDTADPRLVASLYSQMQALRVCAGDSCRAADAIVLPTPAG
jgi:arylsulfatase A-like enzyme